MAGDPWSESARDFYNTESLRKGELRNFRVFVKAYGKIAQILSLSSSDSVLDIGCGCGELAAAISDKVDAYCGIDISDKSLAVAGQRNPDAKFIQADMTALPFDQKYDHIVAMTSLEFCADKNKALQEFNRVLNDSGRMYIEVRSADFVLFKILAPIMKFLIKCNLIVPYEADGFRDLAFAEWRELLNRNGFDIIELRSSIRPAMYGGLMTRAKNLLISAVKLMFPVRCHYMVGFVCKKC